MLRFLYPVKPKFCYFPSEIMKYFTSFLNCLTDLVHCEMGRRQGYSLYFAIYLDHEMLITEQGCYCVFVCV
jgi:hypothetical protein